MTRSLRLRWAEGDTTLGCWCILPEPLAAEALSRSGFDYVCIDTQHGAIDRASAAAMLGAIAHGDAATVMRVPWNDPGDIGVALDAGALSVIVPMIDSVADAEAAVKAAHYAPGGQRSFGPSVVSMREGADYFERATDEVAVIPMIETAGGLAAVDDIVALPGVEAVYVGPADLAVSLGLPPRGADDEPVFVEALDKVVRACENAGVVAGIHTTRTLAPRRIEERFRMITVDADLLILRDGASATLAGLRDGGDADPVSGPSAMY